MSNLTTVGITSGIPSSGTGTVSTIDNMFSTAGTPSSNVQTVQFSTTLNSSNNPIVVGLVSTSAGVTALGQASMANSLPVTIASNSTAFTVTPSSNFTVILSSNPTTIPSSALTVTSNDWLYDPGTGNNGLVASAITLSATGLSQLGTSAVNQNSTTTFTNSNTGQAAYGMVFLTIGTTGLTATSCTAGSNLAGWFQQSLDGTAFESSAVAPIRGPDFIIPVSTAASGSSQIWASPGPVRLPALNFRVLIQNNLNGTFASSDASIKLGPISQKS